MEQFDDQKVMMPKAGQGCRLPSNRNLMARYAAEVPQGRPKGPQRASIKQLERSSCSVWSSWSNAEPENLVFQAICFRRWDL